MTHRPNARLVVRPVRFTDQVEEMRDLLQLLGLVVAVEGDRGGWSELVAGHGMVALHAASGSQIGARSGQTTLSFQTDDADRLAQALRTAGFDDAHVYDEGYGRVLGVTDPLGEEVAVDEYSDDLYGYRLVESGDPDPALTVVPVRFTDDAVAYARFLRALGLTGDPDPDYSTFETPSAHGLVGVHRRYDPLPIVGGPGAAAHLTFLTTRDLRPIEQRLRAAGHGFERVDEDFGSFLDVVDPDGMSVQVHRLA